MSNEQQPHQPLGHGVGPAEQHEHENAHDHHDQQKAGAAAWMKAREARGIGRSQLGVRFMVENALVLGAVIFEHPLDFLEARDQDDIAQKESHANEAVDEVEPEAGTRTGEIGEHQRHIEENRQPEGQCQSQRQPHLDLLRGGLGLTRRRAFTVAGRPRIHLGKIAGVGQCLHAEHQRFEQHHGAAKDRPGEDIVARQQRAIGPFPNGDRAVSAAARDGHHVRRAHHHALDDRLSPDHELIVCHGVVRIVQF